MSFMLGHTAAVFLLALFSAQSADDWKPVTNAYIRLVASMKHEPIVALKSKIADLDAEVEVFVRKSKMNALDPRVSLVRQALGHLDIALDPPKYNAPEFEWSRLKVDKVQARDLTLSCDAGFVGIPPSDMQRAHVARAIALLNAADGMPLEELRPLADLANNPPTV